MSSNWLVLPYGLRSYLTFQRAADLGSAILGGHDKPTILSQRNGPTDNDADDNRNGCPSLIPYHPFSAITMLGRKIRGSIFTSELIHQCGGWIMLSSAKFTIILCFFKSVGFPTFGRLSYHVRFLKLKAAKIRTNSDRRLLQFSLHSKSPALDSNLDIVERIFIHSANRHTYKRQAGCLLPTIECLQSHLSIYQ